MYSVLLHALILLPIVWILSSWMEATQELIIVEKDLRYAGFLDTQNQTAVSMIMVMSLLEEAFRKC